MDLVVGERVGRRGGTAKFIAVFSSFPSSACGSIVMSLLSFLILVICVSLFLDQSG